jgi:hypothetical protein
MTENSNSIHDQDNTRSESDHPQLNQTDRGSPVAVQASSTGSRDHSESTGHVLVTSSNLPASVFSRLTIFCGSDGNAYLLIADTRNFYILRIGSRQANNILRRLAHRSGAPLKTNELRELNDELTAHAELSGDTRDVWCRVAQVEGGVELDIGDDHHTRVQIMPGKVTIKKEGSKTLFYRPRGMRAFVMPDEQGNLALLNKYLNLHPVSIVLLVAWISYTLAHPKIPTTNFVILVLMGDQGSGKTLLCRIIQSLIDPSIVGVQTFPQNQKDFVIAAQNAHVLFYDNMRSIKPPMADMLCIASTGGAMTTRQLYTDAEQQILQLHVALVLNGIHSFIDQPDLSQRSLPLHLLPIDENNRRSESVLFEEFQADLPMIFRGLLDLIANVLTHLPTVEVTSPERSIDFVRWLAAVEKVDGAPEGIYQDEYTLALKDGMLDSLQENPLAAAVMTFAAELTKDK